MLKLINFLAFQLGWFGCLWTVRKGDAGFGIGIITAILLLHLVLSTDSRREAFLILVTIGVGAVVDGANLATGVFIVGRSTELGAFPPTWLFAIWALFATTLNSSLAWLQGKLWPSVLFGMIAGPLMYVAGARLTRSQISFPVKGTFDVFLEWSPERMFAWPDGRSAMILALEWAVVFPLLLLIARKLRPPWAEQSD